jgi:hypothetical protein
VIKYLSIQTNKITAYACFTIYHSFCGKGGK